MKAANLSFEPTLSIYDIAFAEEIILGLNKAQKERVICRRPRNFTVASSSLAESAPMMGAKFQSED